MVRKTMLGSGIVKLSVCNGIYILAAIKQFYCESVLDLHKMEMLTLDTAPVTLGRNNGVAEILRCDIPHLCGQHCIAY